MIPADTLRVFRRASRGYVAHTDLFWARARQTSSQQHRGDHSPELEAVNRRAVASAERALKRTYSVSEVANAERLYEIDRAFCEAFYRELSVDLGQKALASMESIHRELWNRYLHQTTDQADKLRDLARAASAWLVYKAGSPFPMIEEDEAYWRNLSRIGPPPEPGQVPLRRPALPGGVRDEEPGDTDLMDASIPIPEDPQPGQPLGPDLPHRYRAWGRPDADHAPFALEAMGASSEAALKFRLLAPEAGGHPVLLMFEQRLGETAPLSPAQLYLTLRKPVSARNVDLLALVRKVEQFLHDGLQTYRDNLQERKWEELRPVLENTKLLLFPRLEASSAEHRFSNHLIEEIVGFEWREIVQIVSLGIAVGLGILLAAPTLAGSLGLSAAAIGTAMVAADITLVVVNAGIAIRQHQERTTANRFAAIDEGLRVASTSDNLFWDVTMDVLMLIVPPAAGVGIRTARRAWLARAMRAIPDPNVVRNVATPTVRRRALASLESPRGTSAPSADAPTPVDVAGGARAADPPSAAVRQDAPEVPARPQSADPNVSGRGVATDPFAALSSTQRRRISRVRTALTGSQRNRIDLEVVHDYLRFFMSRGHSLDEAIELTGRWANIQAGLQRLGQANLPNPNNLRPMQEYLSQPGVSIERALSDAESRIAIRLGEAPPNPAGLDRARAAEVRGRQGRRVTTPRMSRSEGLIEYGESDLSRAVIRRRSQNQDFGLRNYAAVEYLDPDGIRRVAVLRSQPNVAHSEPRLIEALRRGGIEPDRITRLYTERSPCVTRAHCSAFLRNTLSPDARVTWSFDFETEVDAAEAIQQGLRRQANRDLGRQVRPGSVTNPRTDVIDPE